jgi:wyosine [tRNA(Phe)-imidazoG37] synthetase (radical SAM superfamily)
MEIESLKTVLRALAQSSPHTDAHYRWKDSDWTAQRSEAIEIAETELERLEKLKLQAHGVITVPDEAKALVHEAIVASVLPMLYKSIDDLISAVGPEAIPKKALIEARKALPPQYKNSITNAAGK